MSKKRQERKARKKLREADTDVPGARTDDELAEELRVKVQAKLDAGEALSEDEIRVLGLKIDVPYEAPPPGQEPVITYASGKTLQDVLREKSPGMFEKKKG